MAAKGQETSGDPYRVRAFLSGQSLASAGRDKENDCRSRLLMNTLVNLYLCNVEYMV